MSKVNTFSSTTEEKAEIDAKFYDERGETKLSFSKWVVSKLLKRKGKQDGGKDA